MSWVLNLINTEAIVRAFFCLQKKPSLTLNCAFIGEAFWLHLFLEKGGNASPRLPDKSKYKKSNPQYITLSEGNVCSIKETYIADIESFSEYLTEINS